MKIGRLSRRILIWHLKLDFLIERRNHRQRCYKQQRTFVKYDLIIMKRSYGFEKSKINLWIVMLKIRYFYLSITVIIIPTLINDTILAFFALFRVSIILERVIMIIDFLFVHLPNRIRVKTIPKVSISIIFLFLSPLTIKFKTVIHFIISVGSGIVIEWCIAFILIGVSCLVFKRSIEICSLLTFLFIYERDPNLSTVKRAFLILIEIAVEIFSLILVSYRSEMIERHLAINFSNIVHLFYHSFLSLET